MTYYLSLADAKHLFELAVLVGKNRTDAEHEALYNLATWLDEHDPQPASKPQYRELVMDGLA